ncbi:hypothetical protein OAA09_00480, partial [bacterium]|nr:hypothetical protein [bacterium]
MSGFKRMSYPSSLISFVDVPEVTRVSSKFHYNFFEPDESVNDSWDGSINKTMRRSGQSIISGKTSPAVIEEVKKRVPRFVKLTWRALKTNNRSDARRMRFLRIKDHLENIQDESSVSNGSFSGLIIQDSGIDDKLTPFLNMSLNLSKDTTGTSPTDKAKELNKRTSVDVSPKFLADSMNSQSSGVSFISSEERVDKSKIKKTARDLTLNVQLNNKFADKIIQTALDDVAGIYNDEMSELEGPAKLITSEAMGKSAPGDISPDEYEVIIDPIRVRMFDVGQVDTESRILGYIIEKFEALDTGELIKIKDIVVENPNRSTFIDTRVKYGATYVYQIKTIAQVDFQSMTEDSSDILSTTMLLSSKPSSRAVIECIEVIPPSEPVDFKGVWHYSKNQLCLMWNFPVNRQRDIKKFQIFRRKSILEPYEMIAMLDFDDSVVRQPDRENITPSRRVYLEQPALTYYDLDFKMSSKYMYTICAIDARNMTSNYSMQLEMSFSKSRNKLISKMISPAGAPKQYPNLYLNTDLFVDTIRDSGHTRVNIYFDPEYLEIEDSQGADLGLIKNTYRGENKGEYQLQFINVDHQKEKKLTIKISDQRFLSPEERVDRQLI